MSRVALSRLCRKVLGAIRDVLLDGTQNVYVDVYGKAVVRLRRAGAENSFMNQAPRFAMETLGLVLISLFVLFLRDRSGGILWRSTNIGNDCLWRAKAFAFNASYYIANWALVAGSKAALSDVLDLLEQEMPSLCKCKILASFGVLRSQFALKM